MSRFFRTAADSDSSSSSDEEEELMSSGDEAPKPVQPKTPMSRFLKTGSGSDSSSSSDDDESDDESDDDGGGRAAPQAKKSRFIKGGADSSSDESSDEEKRVVKSARDKRLEELQAIGQNIENKLKIGDWVATSNEYDKLARLVEKRVNVSEPVPPYWIKTLLSLDASLAATKEKDPKKKINASNAKALNGMKNKVKKASKEYEDQIKRYQEDADKYERDYTAFFEPVAAPTPARAAASARNHAAVEGEEEEDGFTAVGKGGKSVQYTAESIYKVLAQVNENRGKKNTDRVEQVKTLEKLLAVAVTTYQRIRVILALIAARFDYNPSATHMPGEMWSSAQKEFDQLVLILVTEPEHSVQEVVDEEYDELVERTPKTEPRGVVRIRGSVISFIDRLDDEFTRSLQNIDPHGTEYIERLRDEKSLYHSICRAQCYFEASKQEDLLARVISRRLEHIYSKPDAVVEALEQVVDGDNALRPSLSLSSVRDARQLVHSVAVILYKSKNSLLRTRAMLCHIYHHALHNDFHTARDMLLMSHLQESIHAADVATQILYNRAEVQLGLCAFRCGLIKESQSLLHEFFSTQRVKELLAQGLHQQRFVTLTPEQEKAERKRQMPFHMHINTELAEAVFLVSSMLIEIPVLASLDSEEAKRKTISKPFRRLLDHANRQVFSGPPENTRDHIMQASKALQDGEWERARDLVQSIAIWNLMPEAKQVKGMLARRIQEEGLRTYLFSNAPYYTTLSLSLLSRIFDLPLRQVTSIVSKMIWSEELAASLDQAAGVVVFHRVEPTRVQQLALTLSEKVAQLVEQNEKTLDNKLGGDRTWGERGDGKGGEKRGEQQATGERRQRTGTRGGLRGGSRGRGARFAQGLGGRVTGAVRA